MGWCPGCGCASEGGGPTGEPDFYCSHCQAISGTDPNSPRCFRINLADMDGCTYHNGTSYLYRVDGCTWDHVHGNAVGAQEIILDASRLRLRVSDIGSGDAYWIESTKACMEYDETLLTFDTATGSSDCTDPAGSTLTITAAPLNTSDACTCIHAMQAAGVSFRSCYVSRVPWNGVSVTVSGLTNGSGSCCPDLNGTYVFNGPPCLLSSGHAGWETTVACGGGTVQIFVELGQGPFGTHATVVRFHNGTAEMRRWLTFDYDCASYSSTALGSPAGTVCSSGTCTITAL